MAEPRQSLHLLGKRGSIDLAKSLYEQRFECHRRATPPSLEHTSESAFAQYIGVYVGAGNFIARNALCEPRIERQLIEVMSTSKADIRKTNRRG